jgi:hypothetical protein
MLLLVTFYFVILATYCRPFFGMVDSFPECERIYIADTVELCVCVISIYHISFMFTLSCWGSNGVGVFIGID